MTSETSRPRSLPADTGVRVSAIIVVGENASALELCLRGVLGEPWVDELILVDAGAPPGVASSLRALQADRRDVRFLQPGELLTHTEARNLGAGRARGRWLLFLDADVVLQRGAAEKLIRAGRLARTPWVIGGGLTDSKGRATGLHAHAPLRRRPAPVEAVDGAFLLTPLAEFNALGRFDEDYTLYGEARDLCRRARDAGGTVWLQPMAEAMQVGAGRVRNPAIDEARRAWADARYARKYAKGPAARLAAGLWGGMATCWGALKGLAAQPMRRLGS